MISKGNITCIPEKDSSKRFLIGKSGHKELLAIGLNPSTANEYNLDPTSRNIEIIAEKNGCDGWWLVNLFPKRTSKPANLPKRNNTSLSDKNIAFINDLLHDKNYNFSKVICCWGNHINDYPYLKVQAQKITNLIAKSGHKCHCIGLTSSGNPYHPAPMPVNRFLGGINNVTLKEFSP